MDRHDIKWTGTMTALVTPFTRDGQVDEDAFRRNIELLIQDGVHGVVVTGHTGEFWSLTVDEWKALFRAAMEQVRGRVTVIGGTTAIATRQVIEMSAYARELGMDGVMFTPPYYVLPTPTDIIAHYQSVSDAVDIPILIYNIPHVTGVNVTTELLLRLSDIERVVAVKESAHDFMPLIEMVRAVGDRIRVFAGYSALRGLPAIAMGVDGFISVADTQVMGREGVDLFTLSREGKIEEARAIQYRCVRLIEALNKTQGTFPAPLKAAMNLVGRPGGYPHDPVLPLTPAQAERLSATLRELNLIGREMVASDGRRSSAG
jgi:4-hydroxy-tetrahydrodipicolinate synthase